MNWMLSICLSWMLALAPAIWPVNHQNPVRIPGPGGNPAVANNKALSFNGSTDYLSSTATVSWTTTKQLSMAFWFSTASFGSGDFILFESCPNYNSSGGCGVASGFIIQTNSSTNVGQIVFATHNAGYNTCTFPEPSTGVFHQYTLTIDNSTTPTTCTAYIDGTPQTVTVQNSTLNDNLSGGSTAFVMSRNGAAFFDTGTLADLAIYAGTGTGVVLSSTDASNLASGVLANSGTISLTPFLYLHGCSTSSPQPDVVASWSWTVHGTTSVAGPSALHNC